MTTADGKARFFFVEADGERGLFMCATDWTALEVRQEGNCTVRYCPECKVEMTWHWDMGELDLDSLPRIENNDFEIFGPPPGLS